MSLSCEALQGLEARLDSLLTSCANVGDDVVCGASEMIAHNFVKLQCSEASKNLRTITLSDKKQDNSVNGFFTAMWSKFSKSELSYTLTCIGKTIAFLFIYNDTFKLVSDGHVIDYYAAGFTSNKKIEQDCGILVETYNISDIALESTKLAVHSFLTRCAK
jgi:hypothetical protein